MTSLYFWLKFLHLVGLAVFLLGHGVSAGTSLALRRIQPDAVRGTLLHLSILAEYVALPGLLLVLVTGVWMGFVGSLWRTGWIWTAIVLLIAVIVVMSALSVPYHTSRDALRDNKAGEVDEKLKRARPLVLTSVGVIGLLALFFLMIFKPF